MIRCSKCGRICHPTSQFGESGAIFYHEDPDDEYDEEKQGVVICSKCFFKKDSSI